VGITAQGWVGHQSAGGEQSHCASLVLYTFYHYNVYYLLFLCYLIKLTLSQTTGFAFFIDCHPHLIGGSVNEWLCGA